MFFNCMSNTISDTVKLKEQGKIHLHKMDHLQICISLQTLKEIVTDMGIPFEEEDIMIYDVVNSDEVWVTTTPYCLAPVVRFNGQAIGNGINAPMFKKVLQEWGKRVGKDLWNEIVNSEPINYR